METLYNPEAAANATPSEEEKKDLQALIELARRRLDGSS